MAVAAVAVGSGEAYVVAALLASASEAAAASDGSAGFEGAAYT